MNTGHPYFGIAVALYELYIIAEVLFTGGHPARGIGAAALLVLMAFLNDTRTRSHADATSI